MIFIFLNLIFKLIANPIYDVVFKYLLDDNKVAKLFIGAILGVEVTKIEFKPQDVLMLFSKTDENNEPSSEFKVFRMDFKALITYSDGSSKLLLIELQKTKKDTDLMRFRKYLGAHYIETNNVVVVNGKNSPLLIITVYFLGYMLKHFEQTSIIRIKRPHIDDFNMEVLTQKESFIETLSHDSIVIQLPQIKHKRRNELEGILTIFEIDSMQKFDMKVILPEKYEEIAKRLNLGLTDEQMLNGRLAQEELIHEFEANKKAIEKERNLKEEAIQNLRNTVQNLRTRLFTISEIATICNLPEVQINKLLS